LKTIPLGTTGVNVSALCLGTMYFGTSVAEEMSRNLLDMYVEAGGTFLDTANAYARWIQGFKGGESEALLGRWLKDRRNRKSLFLATKVGFPVTADDLPFGLRAADIAKACDISLNRMGIDTIDLFYAHADDRSSPLDERLEAFDRLVRAGKVRYVGASNMVAWRLEEARNLCAQRGWAQCCCIQQRYSYVRPQAGAIYDPHAAVNDELLDYCRTRGLALLAYSPLLMGAFSRNDRPLPEQYVGPDTDLRLKVLREVAAETGATPNQVVYAWMIESPPAVIPLMTASRPDQMTENLKSLDLRLSSEQLERLSKAGNRKVPNGSAQRKIPVGGKEG
jgi:aryl-alcohol dehydrogenase-like predicted oxidoreductase